MAGGLQSKTKKYQKYAKLGGKVVSPIPTYNASPRKLIGNIQNRNPSLSKIQTGEDFGFEPQFFSDKRHDRLIANPEYHCDY